jgi:hypothetical protein
VCFDYFSSNSLLWKICSSKLDNRTFDFINILAQIINKFFKSSKTKNNFIYAEMIKVLWYTYMHVIYIFFSDVCRHWVGHQ